MVTLNQIADLILHDFEGGIPSKDSKLDRRDIIKKARSFIHTIVKPLYYEKWNEGDKSAIPQCIYSYELSLSEDAEGKYIAIPDFYMSLPDNRGIHRVYVKGNRYADFVIQNNPGVTGDLPHSSMKGVQYCSIEGLKVRMNKGCTAKKADKMILQIINIAPEALADDADLPLMGEQLAELLKLLKMDYAPFANVQTDYLNNNNPNIR